MIREEIKKKIREIVGPENALDSNLDRFAYSYDASFVPLLPANEPDLVVRPLTTEEVSKLMVIAYENEIPVTPRGVASGRTGGSIPLKGGISLSLDRMTKILELDEKNMMVWAEAGVRTFDLYNHCAAKGLFYPPDPASWKFSTIGGNVAENAGGMRAVKYGVTTDYVMGLEVVLTDGTVLQTGGKAIKNVTGYDLVSLFTGSEGTLGIFTKSVAQAYSYAERPRLDAGYVSDIERVARRSTRCSNRKSCRRRSRLWTERDRSVARHRKMDLDPAIGACIVIEIDGGRIKALETQAKQIEAVAEECGSIEFRVAQSQQESRRSVGHPAGPSAAVAGLAPNRAG